MVKVHANSHAGEVDPLGETESQEGSQPGSPKPIVVGEIKVSGDDAAISAPATLIYSTNFYTKNGQARSFLLVPYPEPTCQTTYGLCIRRRKPFSN